MAKYLILWEVDANRIPVDMKERAAAWSVMTDMVKQDIADGGTVDWGAFVGEMRGYTVSEGENLVAMSTSLQRFVPWLNLTVHQVMTLEEVTEAIKAISG